MLLVAKHHAIGRASGVKIEGEVVWHYRLRDRKIVGVTAYEDRAAALNALGPAE